METRDYDNMPEAEEMAIWIRESKQGKKYLSGLGKLEGKEFKFVMFKNEEKTGKQPDYSFKKKVEENDTWQPRKPDVDLNDELAQAGMGIPTL